MSSQSADDTRHIARSLVRDYPHADCFYLEGELGAGKTVFAKGLAEALGIDPERVVSPTFALVNRYGEGARPVYHVDLYRIEREEEIAELGLDDVEDDAILMVEWPAKLGRLRRTDAVCVRITRPPDGGEDDDSERRIEIVVPGSGEQSTGAETV